MDKNKERLVQIALRKKEIESLIDEASAEDLEKLEVEVRALNEEINVINRKADLKVNSFIPVLPKKDEEEENDNPFATKEYRKSFQSYVVSGKRDEVLLRVAPTDTTAVAAVIPTTIMDHVIQELKDYGEILPLVTFTNYKGGVSIPIGGTKPTASWIAEGSVANAQEQEISGSIIFGYYKLQLRVTITLEAATVSLDLWEKTVAENIAEAFAVAFEAAVVNGSGVNQPLGITSDLYDVRTNPFGRIPAANQVYVKPAALDFAGWNSNLFAKIPLAYRKKRNGVILMNPGTWDTYIVGLVDAVTGQPIARVDHGIADEPVYRFMGRKVILTDLLPSLADAADEDVFLIYGDLSEYLINTNLQMTLRNYFDEDTDNYVRKATLLADGKIADPYGFVVLTKDNN